MNLQRPLPKRRGPFIWFQQGVFEMPAYTVPIKTLDCDRFTAGELDVLLLLIAGASFDQEGRRWLESARAKLEEQRNLLQMEVEGA